MEVTFRNLPAGVGQTKTDAAEPGRNLNAPRLADTVRMMYGGPMMFADETADEVNNTDRMLRRMGWTDEEIDFARDYE